MQKEIVRFVSAKPYVNASNEVFNKLFFCLHERREVVIRSVGNKEEDRLVFNGRMPSMI